MMEFKEFMKTKSPGLVDYSDEPYKLNDKDSNGINLDDFIKKTDIY